MREARPVSEIKIVVKFGEGKGAYWRAARGKDLKSAVEDLFKVSTNFALKEDRDSAKKVFSVTLKENEIEILPMLKRKNKSKSREIEDEKNVPMMYVDGKGLVPRGNLPPPLKLFEKNHPPLLSADRVAKQLIKFHNKFA